MHKKIPHTVGCGELCLSRKLNEKSVLLLQNEEHSSCAADQNDHGSHDADHQTIVATLLGVLILVLIGVVTGGVIIGVVVVDRICSSKTTSVRSIA